MSNTDFRVCKTAQAALKLQELGAPRSKFTLRKDHRKQPGESGPRFVRDPRGTCIYFVTELERWAAEQREKLSEHNAPSESIKVARAALEARRANQNRLQAVVVEDSTATEKSVKNKRAGARAHIRAVPFSRSGSPAGQK
jgi:hypothetical protein